MAAKLDRRVLMQTALASGAALLPGAGSGAQRGEPVPQQADEWRHVDADSARSRYRPGAIRPPLKVTWSMEVPHRVTQVVAAADVLYAVGNHLTALYAADGRSLWSLGPEAFSHLGMGDQAVATDLGVLKWVSSSTHRAYVPMTQVLVAWRAADGKELFAVQGGRTPGGTVQLRNGLILAGTEARNLGEPSYLMVVDPAAGTVKERRNLDIGWMAREGMGKGPGLWPEWLGEYADGSDWLFIQGQSTLVTLEGGVGGQARGLRWEPTHVRAGNRFLYKVERRPRETVVQALDRRCKVVWETILDGVDWWGGYQMEVAAVAPGFVVFAGGAHFGALDSETGRLLWIRPGSPERIGGVVAVVGDVLYASTTSGPGGTVVGFSLARGELLGSVPLPSPRRSSITNIIAHRGALCVVQRPTILGPGETGDKVFVTRLVTDASTSRDGVGPRGQDRLRGRTLDAAVGRATSGRYRVEAAMRRTVTE